MCVCHKMHFAIPYHEQTKTLLVVKICVCVSHNMDFQYLIMSGPNYFLL